MRSDLEMTQFPVFIYRGLGGTSDLEGGATFQQQVQQEVQIGATGWDDRLSLDSGAFLYWEDDLTDGTLSSAINQNEFGTVTASEAWTGTDPNGLKTDASGLSSYCNDWAASTFGGEVIVGLSNATNSTWTTVYLQFCNRTLPLYCIQQ